MKQTFLKNGIAVVIKVVVLDCVWSNRVSRTQRCVTFEGHFSAFFQVFLHFQVGLLEWLKLLQFVLFALSSRCVTAECR